MASDRLRQLEDRVVRLEEELRQLKAQLPAGPEKPGWRALVGTFKGDKVFHEIVREGRKIREAEREAARKEEANGAGEEGRSRKRRTRQPG